MEKIKSGKIYFEQSFERLKDDPKIILVHVLLMLVSFILSFVKIGFDISPFGVSLCSVAPGEYLFSCFVGQALGYAASQSVISSLRYIISALVIRLIVFKISGKRTEYRRIWFLTPVCVFCVSFIGGVVLTSFTGMDVRVFFAILSESSIAAVASYFFSRSFEVFESRDDLSVFSPQQYVCLIFSSGVLLLSLSTVNFYEVSVSRILVGLLILLFAYTGGEFAACLAGIVGGISVGIYTNSSFDIISLSLSGLMSGVFSPLGSIGCAAAFIICRFAVFFFSSPEISLFSMFVESAASITLFMALPKNFAFSIKNTVLHVEEKPSSYLSKKDVCEKIKNASECLAEISESVDKVSTQLKRLSDSNQKAIYCRIQSDVCAKCGKYDHCFNKNFSSTFKYFEQISKIFAENERVTEDELPKKFASLCADKENFLKSFEKHYIRHKEFMRQEAEVENVRTAFRDRLECTKEILQNFSKDFSSEKTSDRRTASAIKTLMRNYGIKVQNVSCIIDEKGVMSIKAVCKNFDSDISKDGLKKDIEDMTLRKFERPEISFLENGITFEVEQKPWISVNTGLVKIPSKGASLCGDNCEYFTEKGVLSVIISDGMGTGGRAAVDSAMSAEFFKKLVRCGFGEDVALKIVNSAMLVKSSYESLSTIDYAKIDLFTGKTTLCKAGAAATVIRKNGETQCIEDASLPVGILREIEFSKENLSLSPSDVIVMMTDGVTSDSTEWIEDEVKNFNRSNAEDLARSIALKALEKCSASKQDDVTVFAAILE